MSRTILMRILTEMQVGLGQPEVDQLYQELLAYFGLIGASNQCQALDAAWSNPYNKREIEEFIKAWLRRKRRKRKEAIAGVV
ncbi:MAG: hypothetical protein AOA66_0527 [Candidatus Bathyarchaeota archaeon BA2]|nr:MAG: hypothetical protein AOA66_0527 [Candidatus Bathyarchaeota archaeon BA2]